MDKPNLSLFKDDSDKEKKYYDGLAAKLFSRLKALRKLTCSEDVLPVWAKRLRQLGEELGKRGQTKKAAKVYLSTILKDHLANIRDQYQPKLYAATTICDNFIKLEEAANRRGVLPPPQSYYDKILLSNGEVLMKPKKLPITYEDDFLPPPSYYEEVLLPNGEILMKPKEGMENTDEDI